MTDWKADLRALTDLYEHPEQFDDNNAGHAVAGFLLHALAHLQAASELLLDYEGFEFPKKPQPSLSRLPRRKLV